MEESAKVIPGRLMMEKFPRSLFLSLSPSLHVHGDELMKSSSGGDGEGPLGKGAAIVIRKKPILCR